MSSTLQSLELTRGFDIACDFPQLECLRLWDNDAARAVASIARLKRLATSSAQTLLSIASLVYKLPILEGSMWEGEEDAGVLHLALNSLPSLHVFAVQYRVFKGGWSPAKEHCDFYRRNAPNHSCLMQILQTYRCWSVWDSVPRS